MKVYITPDVETAPYGLKRVMEALHQHLPDNDIEIVETEEEADLVNVHSMAFVETKKPVVYTSHGLHWAEIPWNYNEYLDANRLMADYMSRSQSVTAVSDWVGHAISRGMLHKPVITGNGINIDDWEHDKPSSGYVLWNKARVDPVCNPDEMNKIAAQMPNTAFVSTFGEQTANVQITGVVDHEVMKDMVQRAGVYLSLARETFGIGTLEAIASGVPVVGWDHGGNRDIIEHGINGYLVPHGDYDKLSECIEKCSQFTGAMRFDLPATIGKWDWSNVVPAYAQAYKDTWARATGYGRKVSIIVTAYNLDKYLGDCLNSVLAQTFQDWECLIIDDCSTDGTAEISNDYCALDGRFQYHKPDSNLKLSGARNFGYNLASGEYIMYLDADDMITARTVDLLVQALDNDEKTHIVYGSLQTMSEDGTNLRPNDWPVGEFNWFHQMSHLNQLPYCSMMRSEVMRRTGGYRVRDYLAEDAAHWCRATSLGFRAKKATDEPTLIYRLRPDSKSTKDLKEFGHGAFTQWFGWKTATTPQAGVKFQKAGKRPFSSIVPFGAQGNPKESNAHCWPVWGHHDPVISVIIPVGPGHEAQLVDALDSLTAQTYPFWEAIVINDTGGDIDLTYAPWARVFDNGSHDIATSRNIGIEKATAPLLLFLDADDFLFGTALEKMLKAYVDEDGSKYIYTDHYNVVKGKGATKNKAVEYDRSTTDGQKHPVTALVRKEHATAVGGFDSTLPGWEDWEFYVKMAVAGYCGKRLGEALLVYRLHSGARREDSIKNASHTLEVMKERYADYYTGAKTMAPCCGGNNTTILEAKRSLGLLPKAVSINIVSHSKDGKMSTVRVEYLGKSFGATTINSVNGTPIPPLRAGANPLHKFHDVAPETARLLVEANLFKLVNADNQDLAQAEQGDSLAGLIQHTPTPAPDGGSSFEAPAPVVVVESGKPFDPTTMTVGEVKAAAVGCTVDQLKDALEREQGGSKRKSAISFLNTLIGDGERQLEIGS